MTTQARCETSLRLVLPISQLSDQRKRVSDPLPLCGEIRFFRGALLAVALCLPVWVLVFWAVVSHF